MEKKNNNYLTLCIILSSVVLLLGGFVIYDKVLRNDEGTNSIKQKSSECSKCMECEKCKDNESITAQCNCTNSNFGEKVSSVKKINLGNVNQKVTIGSKTFNLKVDNSDNIQDVLYINNEVANSYHGYNNLVILAPPVAYQTEKYIFFTSVGQDDDGIVYAIDENGKEIVINDNGYQMHGFKIVDGYLHATGHIFCGLECDNSDKELVIKYIDNTLIVTEAK